MKLTLNRETLRTLSTKSGIRTGAIATLPHWTDPVPEPSGGPGSGYLRQCGQTVPPHAMEVAAPIVPDATKP